MSVQDTLKQRGKTHGDFSLNAMCSQQLKQTLRQNTTTVLAMDQQEALEVICAKIARICTGSPQHTDSWHDIAGYATLIENRLIKDQAPGGM
ncbi:MAG: DUF6378 domain-containing protein [Thiomicrorhabdus sp.]|jgi:ABC-type polysaccharide/polyol phosphate transport system ATPase subunit|nr:DUF6378 domain-containing protein [Thiomicrorhabdus sp.]